MQIISEHHKIIYDLLISWFQAEDFVIVVLSKFNDQYNFCKRKYFSYNLFSINLLFLLNAFFESRSECLEINQLECETSLQHRNDSGGFWVKSKFSQILSRYISTDYDSS